MRSSARLLATAASKMPKRKAPSMGNPSDNRVRRGIQLADGGNNLPKKMHFRQRAHINPLGGAQNYQYPVAPERMDWGLHFPDFAAEPGSARLSAAAGGVEVADVGCGFGGLIVHLAPLFPTRMMVGMEIRPKVTEYVRLRILALRKMAARKAAVAAAKAAGATAAEAEAAGAAAEAKAERVETDALAEVAAEVGADETQAEDAAAAAAGGAGADAGSAAAAAGGGGDGSGAGAEAPRGAVAGPGAAAAGGYRNISVIRTNAMRYFPCFFERGQLTKLFFCFADPQFKPSHHRRRIVTTELLAEYAYALRPGGRLYVISDVRDLHNWNAAHAAAHPAFREIPAAESASDPCIAVMRDCTEEGKKAAREGRDKYWAVYERVTDEEALERAAALSGGDWWADIPVHYTYEPAPLQAANAEAKRRNAEDKERKAKGKAAAGGAAAAAAEGGEGGEGGEGAAPAAAAADPAPAGAAGAAESGAR